MCLRPCFLYMTLPVAVTLYRLAAAFLVFIFGMLTSFCAYREQEIPEAAFIFSSVKMIYFFVLPGETIILIILPSIIATRSKL
jgi:hypothetical protein